MSSAGRKNALENTASRAMIDKVAYARTKLRDLHQLRHAGRPLPDSKRVYTSLYTVAKMDDDIVRYGKRRSFIYHRPGEFNKENQRTQTFDKIVQNIRDMYSTGPKLRRSFGRRFHI